MKMRQKQVLLALLVACAPSAAGADKVPVPRPKPAIVRPAPPAQDGVTDLSHAIPAKALSSLPSTADQFRTLKKEIAKDQPEAVTAKSASDALARQAETLRHRLVTTAARVEALEREKVRLDADIVRLSAENASLSAGFARDRVSVSRLLAVLERLQHDMPPAMVLRPNDALSAARGAMLIGASLPSVYGEAAALARRIDRLRKTRLALVARRAEAERNASLSGASAHRTRSTSRDKAAGSRRRRNPLRRSQEQARQDRLAGRQPPGAAGKSGRPADGSGQPKCRYGNCPKKRRRSQSWGGIRWFVPRSGSWRQAGWTGWAGRPRRV